MAVEYVYVDKDSLVMYDFLHWNTLYDFGLSQTKDNPRETIMAISFIMAPKGFIILYELAL